MKRDFQPIEDCLSQDRRWLVIEGIDPAEASDLFAHFREKDARVQWALVEQLRQGDTVLEWKVNPPPLVVVDALHCTDSQSLAASLKFFLKDFPQTQFIFLVPASIGNIAIASYYGKGATLFGESLSSVDIGRADGDLLRHAHKLVPAYGMKDLVLGPVTALKLREALSYVRTKGFCEDDWGFRKRHSRGHGVTVLFHGASGTGKTMAAEAVAAELGLPLYQVDLSSLVSKWVGETEKNLKAVFRAAEGVKGILLFDEGDALFGNRTDVKSSQDRYGNMEVNYLLQEVERFNGVLLLSTNHFNNMDPAFLRRFTYTITFGAPVQEQRRTIWERNVPREMPLAQDVDFNHLAQFGLTGGNIKNCIRHAAARAAAAKGSQVKQEDFLWSIKRELQKHDLEISRETVGEEFWRRVAPDWEFRAGS